MMVYPDFVGRTKYTNGDGYNHSFSNGNGRGKGDGALFRGGGSGTNYLEGCGFSAFNSIHSSGCGWFKYPLNQLTKGV